MDQLPKTENKELNAIKWLEDWADSPLEKFGDLPEKLKIADLQSAKEIASRFKFNVEQVPIDLPSQKVAAILEAKKAQKPRIDEPNGNYIHSLFLKTTSYPKRREAAGLPPANTVFVLKEGEHQGGMGYFALPGGVTINRRFIFETSDDRRVGVFLSLDFLSVREKIENGESIKLPENSNLVDAYIDGISTYDSLFKSIAERIYTTIEGTDGLTKILQNMATGTLNNLADKNLIYVPNLDNQQVLEILKKLCKVGPIQGEDVESSTGYIFFVSKNSVYRTTLKRKDGQLYATPSYNALDGFERLI